MKQITVEELRIGNLIWRVHSPYGTEHNRWVEVVDKIDKYNDLLTLPSSYTEPISLTEEWLIKAGFKRSEAEDVVYYQHGKLVICNWDNKGFIMSNAFSFDLRVELKTVHQLQNLYFALTGEELKINS
jgi:hypothetical protein